MERRLIIPVWGALLTAALLALAACRATPAAEAPTPTPSAAPTPAEEEAVAACFAIPIPGDPLVPPATDADWSKGPPGAPLVLIEYGDFQ